MAFAITVITFIIIILVDYLPLLRMKKKKESIVYGVLLVFAFAILTAREMGVEIGSPLSYFKQWVQFFRI